MHHAALLREDAQRHAETLLGDVATRNPGAWTHLSARVQDHIKASNYGYRTALRAEGVDYENARGRLVGARSLALTHADGREETVRARHVVVAVGGRPTVPSIPGAELCITSDDLFSLPTDPGEVLCIGASYVSLECAGLLTAVASAPATVAIRSSPLRGFDQEMAELVVSRLEAAGTRVLRGVEPREICRLESGRLAVHLRPAGSQSDGEDTVLEVDTVLAATGRRAATQSLGLEAVSVAPEPATGRLRTDDADAVVGTDWLHAIGDCAADRPELTPVATMAGRRLAQRLFGGGGPLMDYASVPTAVFTPTEYACVGATEEAATAAAGPEGVEVFHAAYDTLEDTAGGGGGGEITGPRCYVKAVADAKSRRVLGLHVLGPGAGDVLQGFAVAMRLGATVEDLTDTVGLHPTHAEEVVGLTASKQNGEPFVKTAC